MPGKPQGKMFREMEQKDIFRQAQKYAFDYADTIRKRTVYPTPSAIAGLDGFVEAMPESIGNAADVLAQLNQYGTPASVAQTGGRYFGFVDGGVIPRLLQHDGWPISGTRIPHSMPCRLLPQNLSKCVNHG